MEYHFYPLGDNAVMIELGLKVRSDTHRQVQRVSQLLDKNPPEWMIEYIPAFTTVTVFYDPVKITCHSDKQVLPYSWVCSFLRQLLNDRSNQGDIVQRVIELPVCYGGELGPDLGMVASTNGLTEEEVIQIHSSGNYLVYMIGFAPGFPYIGGMSKSIAAPRRKTPRLSIPPGSVGIGGEQTGIYPVETPGGWQIIGRCPKRLFRPEKEVPSLLKAGDKIKFKPISLKEYYEWEAIRDDNNS